MATYFLAPNSYHERSLATQRSDMTVAVLTRAGIETATAVLDVGCGAGQTLRVVEGLNAGAMLIGLDPDEGACRSGDPGAGRIHFIKGEGERLPLCDGAVSHVICRVALNYMHQARALREMARVLAPGGKLILSFICAGYSLSEVFQPGPRGWRRRLGSLKDLLAGGLLQAAGYQGRRHTLWGRSVPYTSVRRLRRQLRQSDCALTWLTREARFLGCPTVSWAICDKATAPKGARA